MTGNRGIYRFTAARLVPAYGYLAPLVFNKSVPAADDVDGQPLAGKHLGPVEQVAVDNQGRLLFSEESGDCVQIRELQADGTVTTLAGRRCPDPMTGSDYREARFPAASTKPDQLYISTTADEFAVTGADELSIGTDRSCGSTHNASWYRSSAR